MAPSKDPLANTLTGLISIEQAAATLGVSHMTVRRMIEKSTLHPWRQLGRVLVSQPEVEKLAKARAATKEKAR